MVRTLEEKATVAVEQWVQEEGEKEKEEKVVLVGWAGGERVEASVVQHRTKV